MKAPPILETHAHHHTMGSHRDSLISLVTFSSHSSKKAHNRGGSSSRKSTESENSLSNTNTGTETPLSSSYQATSSVELLKGPRTPQTMLDTPPRLGSKSWSPNARVKSTNNANTSSIGVGHLKDLSWELLREVLFGVSPDHPDFFAVYVDSTKSWYRGYLFQSQSEFSKMVPFAVKFIATLGEPAKLWLLKQSCNNSLRDSVRMVSLEWLFAIPDQRLPEVKIVQLIDELRRLRDPGQRVRFMNRVNSVLGLPIFSRTHDGDIMSVGKYPPSDVASQQVSLASPVNSPQAESEFKLEQWLPRDLEVQITTWDANDYVDHCIVKLHLRQVTPQGLCGKRLSETFEVALKPTLKCAFRHLLPGSPSHVAMLGRTVLVCELFDALTSRYIGVGIAALDRPLQPDSLEQTFMDSIPMYSLASSSKAMGASLYKGLITGGATGLTIPDTLKEMTLEITPKLRSHPSLPVIISTVNDYLNLSETVLVDVEKLIILKQPSLLASSVNDPLLIRIEGQDHAATPEHEVGVCLKLSAHIRHVSIQLLNGSTIVATSKVASRDYPVAAAIHRVPLFDVEDHETVIGFVNLQQTYMGSDQLQPPPVIMSIIRGSFEFDLSAVKKLGLLDLRIWAGSMITSLLTQLVDGNDTMAKPEARKFFNAFVALLQLGMSPETRYLFELYTPPRRLLAAPVASILLQQYSLLIQEQSENLPSVFEAHLLLGRFLDVFGVSPSEFRLLTQAFMALFSDNQTPPKLLQMCLQHIDELYVVNTCPEIASQIGSVLTAASYVSSDPTTVDFYWLLTRVARSGSYSTVFSKQYPSLILSITDRFWQQAGEQSLEEVRGMMSLMKALPATSIEAPSFLSLCMGVLIMYEPSFRAFPNGPLFEPHNQIPTALEPERATAILETCLVIFDLTDSRYLPSRSFLHRLEAPLDLVYQLCLCADIMSDSFVPHEWASLNLALLECALRCTEYAGNILELVAMPESTMQAGFLNKRVWKHVFKTFLSLLSDSRINFGLARVGADTSPLLRVGVAYSLLATGIRTVARLWRALAKGGHSGGYQVQFYEEYELWGYVFLLGLNAEQSSICDILSDMLSSLLDGGRKLYGSSGSEALRLLLLSMDHMFRYLAPLPRELSDLEPKFVWPQFRSTESFLKSSCRYLSDLTFEPPGCDMLTVVLKAVKVLRTYWSDPHSSGTLISLWEVLELVKEFGVYDMFEKYFGDFVGALRSDEEADEKLAVAYFEAAQSYSSSEENLRLESMLSPRLPPQSTYDRRQTLVEMSLQHCAKANVWKLAERILEAESQWLKESHKLEDRSKLVTKWLPIITAGLTSCVDEREHNWYLVKFHGAGFGVLAERVFVWEKLLDTRLSDAIEVLSAMFNGVTCLPWDSLPKCTSPGPYISVLTLTKENEQFTHVRPIRDRQTELTHLVTISKFPSATGFVEVLETRKHTLSPSATALRDVRSKTEELRLVCAPQKFKQLDLVLSGILNAAVNGGMSRYSELLSCDSELLEAFRDLKDVVDDALVIYDQQCGEELRGQYNLLYERARQWQALNSVESGFI